MNKTLPLLLAACFLCLSRSAFAAAPTDPQAELGQLVTEVKGDLDKGAHTEADLAWPLKQFDALLAEHKAEKTDDVAMILLMKARLYLEVIGNDEKGLELLKQLKVDFPDTQVAAKIGPMIAALEVQRTLAVGKTFPDFDEKDLDGRELSVAGHKGKVLLVDFWATWCPPCRGEIPNVVATYKAYHDKGFDIVGVSLDQAGNRQGLVEFLKQNQMTWPQYFDGKFWENKLAVKYGVQSIPATFLLGRDGKIIARNLRGEALGQAVAQALAQ